VKVKLTPAFVMRAKAEPGKERTIYWDTAMPSFGLVVTAQSAKSYVVQYRAGRLSRRMKLKNVQSLAAARQQAKVELGEVAKRNDPLAARRKETAAATSTLRAVATDYLKREGKKLRSANQRAATLERLVYPKFGSRQIDDIRRSEIVNLLDQVEDERGPVMADHALAYLRKIFNWHASRSDDFRSPIVRGMARTKPKERQRQRTLTDDELRAVWKAADTYPGPFGRLVQFLLLTATRRNEAAHMRRGEVSDTDWTIPQARYKTGLELLIPLSPMAMATLDKLPRIGNAGFVFTTGGKTAVSGFSKFKRDFDKACGVKDWTLHDLRRTARSLMSRADVSSDHAERCLGHVIGGVRGVYDRHEFHDEKRRAFEALASLVERILNPQANVVPLHDDDLPGAAKSEKRRSRKT
jgi:integrase